ncbi:MAG: hypothetical protein C4543_07045 [Ignavibacteriales bacterium]|jgi:hypothetical protein|nr:MAG: hypothetical protein C4543_07045 [Ignavibacteriales bacterium]
MKQFTPSTDKTFMRIFISALILCLVPTLLILFETVETTAYLIALFVFLVIGIIIWMTIRINFIVNDHNFLTKFGPFSVNIDLRTVVKITDRYSLFITPSVLKIARSNNTISLRYRKKNSLALHWLTISIEEENEFIREVLVHSPNAELELRRIKLD